MSLQKVVLHNLARIYEEISTNQLLGREMQEFSNLGEYEDRSDCPLGIRF